MSDGSGGANLQLGGPVKLCFKIPSELLHSCHIVSRKVANSMKKVAQIRLPCVSRQQQIIQTVAHLPVSA